MFCDTGLLRIKVDLVSMRSTMFPVQGEGGLNASAGCTDALESCKLHGGEAAKRSIRKTQRSLQILTDIHNSRQELHTFLG